MISEKKKNNFQQAQEHQAHKSERKKGDKVTMATTSKEKFHCDKCNYSCLSKKSLKKKMSQKHEIRQNIRKI